MRTIFAVTENERTMTGMDEYIEREAAIRMLRGSAIAKYPLSFSFGIFASADELEKLPAADVAPVRRGRWLCVDTDAEQFFLCNRCKKKEYWESSYCPACGAKMDGDMENN